MNNETYASSLDGFKLDIRLSDLSPHIYSTDVGREFSTYIFVLDGWVNISSGNRAFTARKGDFFCIPPMTRCHAKWENNDERVKFYSIHLTENPAHGFGFDFELTKLPEFSNDETLSRLEEIYFLMQGSDTERLRAIGLFICFFCELRPLLMLSPRKKLSEPLICAVSILESSYAQDITVAELAARVHVSESHLHHLFKSELGQTPIAYRNELRISHASQLISNEKLSIGEIAEQVGFSTTAHFRKVFKNITGTTPHEHR